MRLKNRHGFSLIELLVTLSLFSIIFATGMMLFVSGQAAWTTTDTNIKLQENLRQILLRISFELQESGTDKDDQLRVSFLDNAGINGTDILRFSVPICPCGTSVIDENGDVNNWGAPLVWGQSGCNDNYQIDNNDKVTICHLPPGNPTNNITLNVSVNSVKAHLAHGDWLGDCDACDPTYYSNKTITYGINANKQLVRKVLDNGNTEITSAVFAHNISDFQVSFNADQTVVTLSIALEANTTNNRKMTMNADLDIKLRNQDG